MAGRYGFDKLYWALFAVFCLLSLVRLFMPNALSYWCVTAASLAFLGIAVFRVLSRNTYKRYREGQKFDALWKKITDFFKLQKNRFRDRKTHVYRRCPSCRVTLRYPKVKGKHFSSCPRCGEKITVKIR